MSKLIHHKKDKHGYRNSPSHLFADKRLAWMKQNHIPAAIAPSETHFWERSSPTRPQWDCSSRCGKPNYKVVPNQSMVQIKHHFTGIFKPPTCTRASLVLAHFYGLKLNTLKILLIWWKLLCRPYFLNSTKLLVSPYQITKKQTVILPVWVTSFASASLRWQTLLACSCSHSPAHAQ